MRTPAGKPATPSSRLRASSRMASCLPRVSLSFAGDSGRDRGLEERATSGRSADSTPDRLVPLYDLLRLENDHRGSLIPKKKRLESSNRVMSDFAPASQ